MGADPCRDPRVTDDLAVADAHPEDTAHGIAVVVPEEVPQAVVHVAVTEPAGAEQPVGVGADDDVGARRRQGSRGGPLPRRRAALGTPRPSAGRRPPRRPAGWPPGPRRGGRGAGRRGRRRCPGSSARPPRRCSRPRGRSRPRRGTRGRCRRIETRCGANAARRSSPMPTTGTGPVRIAARRVRQADGPVVGAVVVRHRDHVDAGPVEDVERGRRGAEVVALAGDLELLGLRGAALGDRGLQVHHGDVRVREGPGDRTERTPWPVEQRGEVQLEVHVTGERQGDGPGGPCPATGRTGRGRLNRAGPDRWSHRRCDRQRAGCRRPPSWPGRSPGS